MEKKSSRTRADLSPKRIIQQLTVVPLARLLSQLNPLKVMLAIGCIVFAAFAIVIYNIAML
jgi:hypothetical protein